MTALRWLKQNNPLYANIDINEEWLQQAMTNDNDLFAGMVDQREDDASYCGNSVNSEPTQNPTTEHNANSTDNDHNSTLDEDGSQTMEYCCSQPNFDNALTIAFNTVEQAAQENGFVIHNVPFDGDCLFTSVGYQLEPRVHKNTLRQMVVNHLDNNSDFYKEFLSQPVTSHDAYNADTEPPTAQDAQIEMIADHELQAELRWEKICSETKR